MTQIDFVQLLEDYSIEFKWLTDATLQVHSIITGNTVCTTEGYNAGVLELLKDELK